MAWSFKYKIILSDKQRNFLKEISKAYTSSQAHQLRAQIVLMSEEGCTQRKIMSELKTTHITVQRWRSRWSNSREILSAYDMELTGSEYRKAVLQILTDSPRSGCPGKFNPEQICQIINVACEQPEESDLALSHWTLSELAEELVRRGIVESISTSQLCVFLKSGSDKAP